MRIALFCATKRGRVVLQRLMELAPQSSLTVFTFPEAPEEPPFVDSIRELAAMAGADFYLTRRVDQEYWRKATGDKSVDLALAVNWRYLIPPEVFEQIRLGAYVFHDSLLPKYRGFSPTVWSLINGEDHTGASLFEIAEDFDYGPLIGQRRIPISDKAKIGEITDEVTQAYVSLLEENLDSLIGGTATPTPQDHSQATYCCKRLPNDNEIDWKNSSKDIFNLIRATSQPYSGAFTHLKGKNMRIWSAKLPTAAREYVGSVPGRVAELHGDGATTVLTGDGSLVVTEVQLEGGGIESPSEILKGVSQTLGR